MKSKIFTIICTSFITITSFSQQISDGLATQIPDFLIPLGSGAYSGFNPTGSIPDLSYQGGWQHLFVVRHPNGNNNFQLQIASSMTENDKLYFRKLVPWSTAVNSSWNEIATRGANTFIGNQYVAGNFQILEESDSRPGGQNAPTKSVLKLSRNGTGNYSWNEHAEFRIGHGGNSVFGSKLDLYINGGANTTSVPDQHVMTWNYDGNVGIGTTNPTARLTVQAGPDGYPTPLKAISIIGPNTPGDSNSSQEISWDFSSAGSANIRSYRGGSWDTYMQFSTNSSIGGNSPQVRMHINQDGNIGIGTTNPTSKLTVAGNINSREVKVTVDAGADFVFENSYNLPSLDSVDRYIKENKHLPEIASADEMKKDGINLSEMNIKLLQKIEEMTLYMIEQNKRMNKMELENQDLKNKFDAIKK